MSAPTLLPASTTETPTTDTRISLGIGEGGRPVLVSAKCALVLLLHRKVAREGGDIRPIMALYGEKRHAHLLQRGHEMLNAFAEELAASNSVGSVPGLQNSVGDNAKSTSLPEGAGEGTNLRCEPSGLFGNVGTRIAERSPATQGSNAPGDSKESGALPRREPGSIPGVSLVGAGVIPRENAGGPLLGDAAKTIATERALKKPLDGLDGERLLLACDDPACTTRAIADENNDEVTP